MTRIAVLGGTGYAGGHIVREAASRGHDVVSFSRTAPAAEQANVTVVTGSALDDAALAKAVAGAEVLVVALAPSGDLAGSFVEVNAKIAGLARQSGARLGVIGGAGTLRVAEDGPRIFELPEYPARYRPYSEVAEAVLQGLLSSAADLDWFVLTPPMGFGSFAPGETTGTYRLGGELPLSDAEGRSAISGADYALAFVDEIERPAHRRSRFAVAH
ncbi:NAD(P)-dependent oxidoreductase [Streptomyces sp. NPDC088923]|uniref:NAD(P)-dependent oxidoreductase n=1 Tax=Streptomyces sp. NPDC088923 TaxID=3365913 RepID=UPI0038127226